MNFNLLILIFCVPSTRLLVFNTFCEDLRITVFLLGRSPLRLNFPLFLWFTMVFLGFPLFSLVYFGVPWFSLDLLGFLWFCMVFPGSPWYFRERSYAFPSLACLFSQVEHLPGSACANGPCFRPARQR